MNHPWNGTWWNDDYDFCQEWYRGSCFESIIDIALSACYSHDFSEGSEAFNRSPPCTLPKPDQLQLSAVRSSAASAESPLLRDIRAAQPRPRSSNRCCRSYTTSTSPETTRSADSS